MNQNRDIDLTEKTISSETVFHGKVFDCIVKQVTLCDGRTARREIIKHNGGACILPIDSEGNAYMVKQFRSPFEEIMFEAPAGKLELNEDPRDCAIRELREETGFVAGKVTNLGVMVCSPGYCSEKISMFLAEDLSFEGTDLDDGEFLNVIKIPFSKIYEMTMNNEITDAKTCICILKAAGRLGYGK
ncbi:MAG: NUDIX hydrolase [Clostridia bacterium]|nr:NUDIX hydrolase [Clostridia bacterium]